MEKEIKKEDNQLLRIWENALESYKKELSKNPNSTFYKGLVSNTEYFIKKIKRQSL